MKRFYQTLFGIGCFSFWLLVCSSACDAQTDLVIKGPDQVAPGKLVRLIANVDSDESPFWIVLKPIELDYEQVDGGTRLIFATGCESKGDVVVMLLAQRVVNDRIVTRQVRKQIQIGLAPDSPPEEEPPKEDPTDPEEPKQDELSRLVADAMKQLPRPALLLAPRVAANFQQVAKDCQAKKFADNEAIWLTLSRLNAQTLGATSHQWEPLGRVLQAEFKRRKIQTPSQHAEPLRVAAEAISKGAQQ